MPLYDRVDDILYYQRVVMAMKETMRLMEEVDEIIEFHGGGVVGQAR